MDVKKIVFAASVCLLTAGTSYAQWRVVTDPKTLLQVTTNLASQKLIEDQHNERLDSIRTKQETLMRYTATMATIKEVYKLTMENISGFGTESKYYAEIGLCAYDIIKDIPELVKVVYKAKFPNKLLCINELGNVTAEAQQLVADFVNIVNNGKIENPLKGQATAETKSDGYNLLNRYDRLTVANKIYSDLLNLRYKIQGMMMMARYATMNDLFFAIDPEGWANAMVMKNHVNMLIHGWNGLELKEMGSWFKDSPIFK